EGVAERKDEEDGHHHRYDNDHQHAEGCVGPEEGGVLSEPVKEAHAHGLDRHDRAIEHDMLRKVPLLPDDQRDCCVESDGSDEYGEPFHSVAMGGTGT